jgi:ABC-2 type transport system permease protein
MIYGKIHDGLFIAWASNPLAVCVELFHQAIWGPTVERVVDAKIAAGVPLTAGEAKGNIGFAPDFGLYVLIAVALTIAALIIGQWVFRRFERTFAQDL